MILKLNEMSKNRILKKTVGTEPDHFGKSKVRMGSESVTNQVAT